MLNTIKVWFKEKVSENDFFKTIATIIFYFIISIFLSGFFINFTRDINDINYILTYVCIILIFIKYHSYVLHGFKTLPSDIKKNYKSLLLIFVIGTLAVFGITGLYNSVFHIEVTNEIEVESLLKTTSLMPFIFGILAPIEEELAFRGVLPSLKSNKVVCGIISALLFATVHIITTPNIYIALLYLIPYSILGLMFSYGTVKTNNVLVSILMHITYNCINIMLLFI